ncbi:Uncharacterised protein [uncultured archaeon]|nr:Uncharacterised protein [uncultured archaeon]
MCNLPLQQSAYTNKYLVPESHGPEESRHGEGGKLTVCIAAICDKSKALVLASDCMITSDGLLLNFEHPCKKMSLLAGCVALTAGDALAYTELFDMANTEVEKLKAPTVAEVVARLKGCYQTIRRIEITERILIPSGFDDITSFHMAQNSLVRELAINIQKKIETYDHGLAIIIAGITNGIAHIYEISNPGTSRCFDSLGFHVIGTGLPHAINALVSRGCNQETPLDETLMIVYEAKKMAERAPGVGSVFTDMGIMCNGKIYQLSRDKIDGELNSIYDKWRFGGDPTWTDDITSFLKGVFDDGKTDG